MQRGVVFTLNGQRFALPLEVAQRVVRAVYVTPLPRVDESVCGVIDVQGEMVPVIDLRRRLGLAAKELDISDQFIMARTPERRLALWVDQVEDVMSWEEGDFVPAGSLVPGSRHATGVARGEDGLLVVHDLDALVSLGVAQREDAK